MKSPLHRAVGLPALPPRSPRSHKGTFGRVLIVGGCRGMAGAAVLAARSALRSGCGLVTIAAREDVADVFPSAVPEATLHLLPASDRDGEASLVSLLEAFRQNPWDSLGLGPGLGTGPDRSRLVSGLLENTPCPQVIDADALNAVASGSEPSPREDRAWTPHPGEFRRLTGELPLSDDDRLDAARKFVEARGGTLCLKGHRTVVYSRDGYTLNLTGNPGMATGGSGDVLTGVIAFLLAQGLDAFAAARLAVYLHGLAGDLAARRGSQESIVAGDIIEELPAAIRDYHRIGSVT